MTSISCDAIILCGGLGTRLRSVVADRPKPMALIDGRPFLDIVVDSLVEQGCHRIIFCAGHKSEWISAHFAAEERFEAVVSVEPRPLGTAGTLIQCRPFIHTATVLVCNGDSFCALDVAGLLNAHQQAGCAATIAVVPADGRQDGGAVTIGPDGRLLAFQEKNTTGAYLNAGFYALQQTVLDMIPTRVPCSLERDVLPALISQGIHAFVTPGPLDDIGTPERLDAFRMRRASQTMEYAHTTQGGQK